MFPKRPELPSTNLQLTFHSGPAGMIQVSQEYQKLVKLAGLISRANGLGRQLGRCLSRRLGRRLRGQPFSEGRIIAAQFSPCLLAGGRIAGCTLSLLTPDVAKTPLRLCYFRREVDSGEPRMGNWHTGHLPQHHSIVVLKLCSNG
jgi:hypothetical protein